MTLVNYKLGENGAVQNWVALDPILHSIPDLEKLIPDTGDPLQKDGRWAMNYWAWHPDVQALKQRIYDSREYVSYRSGAAPIPGEGAHYAIAAEDHTLDFSRFNFEPTHSSAVAFTILQSPTQQIAKAKLLTIGPSTVWANGVEVCRYSGPFSYVHAHHVPFDLPLGAGENIMQVQADMVAMREARLCIGLLVEAENVEVAVPINDLDPGTWQQAEASLAHLQLHQHIFPELPVRVTYSHMAQQSFECRVEVQLHLPDRAAIANPDIDSLLSETHRLTMEPGETVEIPISSAIMEQISRLPEESTVKLVFRPARGLFPFIE
ncbi:MAG: hypothetical protein AAFR56_16880, partial [Chloroflexota bacterium]